MSKKAPDCEACHYEGYLRHREFLLRGAAEQGTSFEKYLVTLSAGSLGLSIALIDKFVAQKCPDYLWMVVLSWVLFGSTLLISLISFLVGESAWNRQVEIWDQERMSDGNAQGPQTNPSSTCARILRISVLVLFGVGALFLALFAVCAAYQRQ